MKNFNVLLTCCSIHVKDMTDCLKNNEEREIYNVLYQYLGIRLFKG